MKTHSLTMMVLLLGIISCGGTDYLDEEDLKAYIRNEDHGLIKKKNAGGLDLTVTFRPNELVMLQETGADADTGAIIRARKQFGAYAYFILSLEAGGKNALYGGSQNMEDFSANLQTLSFRMGEKASLITSKLDTIPVADYVFDRTYGMGGTNVLFAFNNEALADTKWVTFHLKDFGMHTGDQRFGFRTEDLMNVPRLKELNIDRPNN